VGRWPLRLGHAWSAFGENTAALLRRWQQTHPDIALELLRIDDRTAGLTRGRVDVAVLRGPVTSRGIVTQLLQSEPRIAAVPTDSPLAARPHLALADLADQTVAISTISGTTALDLWPVSHRPTSTLPVANVDDWLAAIAAGRAVGVSALSTAGMHPYPGVAYVRLTDAPDLPVVLAWTDPPTHPAIADLVTLAREVVEAHPIPAVIMKGPTVGNRPDPS
jgi:DNA-binding transcriptional LysR family regulator